MTAGFEMVFADEHVYVVNKAPGIGFHREGDVPGIMDMLREDLGDDALWPVHRLDRMTSGLLVVARSAEVASQLAAAFMGHQVEKYYLAVAAGKPKKKQGLIKGDMVKGRGGAWRLQLSQENPAVTQFFCFSLSPGYRLYVLRPRTGKTHQLRVAMKSLSTPILGDELYGGEPADRGYLHAYSLSFTLRGKPYHVVCQPTVGEAFVSDAFTQTLAELPGPWEMAWPGLS